MKLTVLGCYGPFPAAGNACSGYLLQVSGKNILLDCGSGVLSSLQKVIPLNQIDMVILSHLHSDHISDLPILGYAIAQKTGITCPLPVYCPSAPQQIVESFSDLPVFDVHTVGDGDTLTRDGFAIKFGAVHHPLPCNAVSVYEGSKTFVYSGDTIITDRLSQMAQGCDLLLIDAGLLDRDWKETAPHMSVRQAAKLAADCDVKQAVLTHFSPLYLHSDIETEAWEENPTVQLAEMLHEYHI